MSLWYRGNVTWLTGNHFTFAIGVIRGENWKRSRHWETHNHESLSVKNGLQPHHIRRANSSAVPVWRLVSQIQMVQGGEWIIGEIGNWRPVFSIFLKFHVCLFLLQQESVVRRGIGYTMWAYLLWLVSASLSHKTQGSRSNARNVETLCKPSVRTNWQTIFWVWLMVNVIGVRGHSRYIRQKIT